MNAMSAVLKKEEDDVLPDDCDAPIDHGWAWMVCLGKNELLFFLFNPSDAKATFIQSRCTSVFHHQHKGVHFRC